MFVDARSLPECSIVDADVCVIGSGPVGIVTASELLRHGLRVVVVESGDLVPDPAARSLNAGESVGDLHVDLVRSRLRAFGGTGRIWGGNCAPFDPIDFEARPWVRDSGWPIPLTEIERHYRRAAAYFGLEGLDYDPVEPPAGGVRLALGASGLGEKLFRHSRVDFGEVHRSRLARGRAVVLTNATVVELELDAGLTEVVGARIALPGCPNHATITARRFVLAAGLENARLLLLSNRQKPAGIGNEHDVVGRYLMDHVNVKGGAIDTPAGFRLARSYDVEHNGNKPFTLALQPTAAVQRREGLLNFCGFLRACYAGEGSDGFTALQRIITATRRRRLGRSLLRDGCTVATHLPEAVHGLTAKAAARFRPPRLVFHAIMEQAPCRDSRLTLADERDPFGLPCLRLDCCLGELERLTYWRANRLVAEALRANGINGVVEPTDSPEAPWPPILHGTGHYMGTTRMHPDPRHGVVDGDCRVHGTANLYVAGGSVFPTGGATMVTINAAALAVRLADHLVARRTPAVLHTAA
jgi:choline dehydrogenase-like flavoprotein